MSPDGYGGSILEHSAADGVTAIQTLLYSINNMLVIILYIFHFFISVSDNQKIYWHMIVQCLFNNLVQLNNYIGISL